MLADPAEDLQLPGLAALVHGHHDQAAQRNMQKQPIKQETWQQNQLAGSDRHPYQQYPQQHPSVPNQPLVEISRNTISHGSLRVRYCTARAADEQLLVETAAAVAQAVGDGIVQLQEFLPNHQQLGAKLAGSVPAAAAYMHQQPGVFIIGTQSSSHSAAAAPPPGVHASNKLGQQPHESGEQHQQQQQHPQPDHSLAFNHLQQGP